MYTRKSKPSRLAIVAGFAVCSLMAGACVPLTATEAPQLTQGPIQVTEGPVPTETIGPLPETTNTEPGPLEPSEVELWVAGTDEEAEIFTGQIEQFMAENPNVQVLIMVLPYADFNAKLLTAVAAGVAPDVAGLSYNHIADFQAAGLLAPLDEEFNVEDFLEDALASNTIQGELYGLPLLRTTCLPHYRSLVLFGTSDNVEGARVLMDFLAQPAQQVQNYQGLTWFPTRRSVYDELGLECPEASVIRPAPEIVPLLIGQVNEGTKILESVLQGQTLNPYEATALTDESGQEIRVAAAAITVPPVGDFDELLKNGLIAGALFAEVPLDILDESGNVIQTIEPGDYAVRWQTVEGSEPKLFLVTPEEQELEVLWATFEETAGPVRLPTTLLRPGSTRICWWIFFLCGCITREP